MGAISFGLDLRLANELKRLLGLEAFVETGTFRGDTLAEVCTLFGRCYSVELSAEYYAEAAARFAGTSNVMLTHGDSAEALAAWRPELENRSCLYFLDAHWCVADKTAGETSQCPLLRELRAIGRLSLSSVVVIDDARLMIAPPPEPHEISQWPAFEDILQDLRALSSEHRLVLWNDVLLFYPAQIGGELVPWLAKHGVDWLATLRGSEANAAAAEERLAAVERMAGEMARLATDLRDKDAEILQKDHEIGSKEEALLSLTADLQKKDGEIQQKESALRRLTDELREKDAEIQRKQGEIEALARACEERLEVINRFSGQA